MYTFLKEFLQVPVCKSLNLHILRWEKIMGEWRKFLEVLCLLAELSTSPHFTLATAKKRRGTAVEQSDLPFLPSALHSPQPTPHEESAGEGPLPSLRPPVLHAEGHQPGLDLLHGSYHLADLGVAV